MQDSQTDTAMPNRNQLHILQVCKKFPYPLKDGESIAIHNLSRALVRAGARVSLLAMNTSRHPFQGDALPAALSHYDQVEMVAIDNRIKPWDALKNLFSDKSYHIERFVSAAFAKKLAHLLQHQHYDVVQMETIYLSPYISVIREHSEACISMRTHNVEHEIWERIVGNTTHGPRRWYLQHLTRKLARYERQMLSAYDLLIAISRRDLDTLSGMGFAGTGTVIPIGLDLNDYERTPPTVQNGHLSMSFIGSLDWMPNVEGLRWFLQEIWPELSSRWPELKLHIAGRNTPGWLYEQQQPGIVVHGEVPDAAAFIQQHPVMVVPLLSGSGMRAKILEGMALGKTILTTSLGLEGIDARRGKEVLVADTPQAFSRHLTFLQQHPKKILDIGAQARQMVAKRYDSDQLGEQLLRIYQQAVCKAVS